MKKIDLYCFRHERAKLILGLIGLIFNGFLCLFVLSWFITGMSDLN